MTLFAHLPLLVQRMDPEADAGYSVRGLTFCTARCMCVQVCGSDTEIRQGMSPSAYPIKYSPTTLIKLRHSEVKLRRGPTYRVTLQLAGAYSVEVSRHPTTTFPFLRHVQLGDWDANLM